jgi:DNA invertase Pin-like site-specific DNA recombinase
VTEERKAAVYVRISRDAEGRELGVARQEEDCRRLADRLGWTITGVYADNDLSASTRSRKRRPAYEAMLHAAETGEVTGIIAYSTSRLTRRPLEFEALIQLAEKGLAICTVAAGEIDLRTANGRAIARTLAAFDAREAEENSERSKRERKQRRERGRWIGGNRPYGWDPDGVTERPAEVTAIRHAVAMAVDGASLAAIARAMPTPTQTGNTRWHPRSVRDILANPRLAGLYRDGSPTPWRPIVDEATWQAVQVILRDPARRSKQHGETRLLTGIAHCFVCGNGTTVHGGITRTGQASYRCSKVKHLDRLAYPVDEYATEIALRYVAREQVVPAGPGDDRAALTVEAAALRQRRDLLADDLGLPEPVLARRVNAISTRLAQIEQEMAATVTTAGLRGLPYGIDALRAWWQTAPVDRRRALIAALPMTVIVRPPGKGTHPPRRDADRGEILAWAAGNVEITWKAS